MVYWYNGGEFGKGFWYNSVIVYWYNGGEFGKGGNLESFALGYMAASPLGAFILFCFLLVLVFRRGSRIFLFLLL